MIQLAPGTPRELGYAEITAPDTQTGVGSKDVAGLSIPVTVGSRPIIVVLSGSTLSNSAAGGWGAVKIQEGASALASVQAVLTTLALPVHRERRLTPSAGSHTYKVVLAQVTSGNTTLAASATDPVSLHVFEV